MTFLHKTLVTLAGVEDTAERIALAFALGVLVGFSPLLGLHTVLALLLAFVLRLNRVALLVGAWVNLPWIMVPYYSLAAWMGSYLTATPAEMRLPEAGFSELFSPMFWGGVLSQWRLLLPVAVGSSILAPALAAAAYPLALVSVRHFRLKRGRLQPDATPATAPQPDRASAGTTAPARTSPGSEGIR